MKQVFFASFSLALSLAVAACGSSSSPSGNTEPAGATGADLDSYCSAFCTHFNQCNSATDVKTCSNACATTNRDAFTKMRADFIAGIQSCQAADDCVTLTGSTEITVCMDTARAEISPTAAASAFCDAYGAAATRCGATLDKGKCLDAWKVYGDTILADAQTCTSGACSDVQACAESAAGITPSTTTASSFAPRWK